MAFKKIIYLLILFLIIPGILMAKKEKKEKPRIAIMDLEAKGVTKNDAEAVADFLRTDLVNTGKFTVIERDRIKDILKEQEMALSGLTETAKAAKIGKLLNCKLIMVGTLSKLGRKYFLNVRVVDVETAETSLGKRESSMQLEDLSEVSRNIASQLAGIDYTPKRKVSGVTYTRKKEKIFQSPPFGIDLQLGFGAGMGWKQNADLENIYTPTDFSYTGDTLNTYTVESEYESDSAYSHFRFGMYFSGLYLGYMNRTYTLEEDSETEFTEISEQEWSSGTDSSESSGTKVFLCDVTTSIQDIMIGFRGWTKGKIDSKIFYFSWRTVKWETEDSNDEPIKYSGPCIGFQNKWAIDIKQSPLDFLVNLGLHGSYLSYEEPAGFTGDVMAIFGGGEFGLGLQLKKIGLYFMINYIVDIFYTKKEFDSQETVLSVNYDVVNNNSITEVMKGLEIRLGYTFDMQALLN